MKYEVEGTLKIKKEIRKFNISMEANSEAHLRDKVAAHFGSKFGLNRHSVIINSVKKIGA